jgi:alkylation response protein AidB-like acyl-CoA dehydrogenase
MAEDMNAPSAEAFRQHARAWLAAHVPEEFRRPAQRLQGADSVRWLKLLTAHGWRALAWPTEHGGLGLDVEKQIIWHEELERARVSRFIDIGVTMLGPTLLRFGTSEQKAHYLPRILSCEDMWCQGYSEPNAGSDLAALRLRADREGEHFVLNGQKSWTTHALWATHCFLLVRTTMGPVKQRGITFLLTDLRTPGITIRPIVNLAGESEFFEVFFDAVRVPVSNVVGAVDEGWTVAKALLGPERLTIGSPALSRLAHDAMEGVAEELGLAEDPAWRETAGNLALELHALTALYREAAEAMKTGREDDNDLSTLKIVSSELAQRITEAAMEMAGEHGAAGSLRTGEGRELDLRQLYMAARPATIYGGSNEIQRNILAKRWLRLPSG